MSSVAAILSGSPASTAPAVAAAAGAAQIALGAASVAVANTAITASSIVVAMINQAAADATLTQVGVRISPGVGFVIVGNAASTAAVACSWAVLKY